MRAGHGQVMAGSELTPAVCMDVLTPSIHSKVETEGHVHYQIKAIFTVAQPTVSTNSISFGITVLTGAQQS